MENQSVTDGNSVNPATDGQWVTGDLSNLPRGPDAENETAATGVGARHGGNAQNTTEEYHAVRDASTGSAFRTGANFGLRGAR